MAEFVIEMIFGILEIVATAIIENDSKNKNN